MIHTFENGQRIVVGDISFMSSISSEHCGGMYINVQQRFTYHIILKSGKYLYRYSDSWNLNIFGETPKKHIEKASKIESKTHDEYGKLLKDWEAVHG